MISPNHTFQEVQYILDVHGLTYLTALGIQRGIVPRNQLTYDMHIKSPTTNTTSYLTFIKHLNQPLSASVIYEGQESAIDCLNRIIKSLPSNAKATDWDLRRIKFVLGEINTWSKDPSTKVSAALFNGKYQICSSYNGFPPNVRDVPERLNNREFKYKLIQHAEANLISTCAKLGIRTEGMTVAVSLFPCAKCAGQLIAAGIKEVVTVEPSPEIKQRWGEDFELSKLILQEAGVKVVIVDANAL